MAKRLTNLGEKLESEASSDAPTIFFPSLHLSDDQVDDLGLNDARVGQEFPMEILARVTSVSERETEEGDSTKRRRSVTLDVKEAGTVSEGGGRSRADRIFGSQNGDQ